MESQYKYFSIYAVVFDSQLFYITIYTIVIHRQPLVTLFRYLGWRVEINLCLFIQLWFTDIIFICLIKNCDGKTEYLFFFIYTFVNITQNNYLTIFTFVINSVCIHLLFIHLWWKDNLFIYLFIGMCLTVKIYTYIYIYI